MERIGIHYHGKELSSEEKARIKAQISFHMGDAPSDASLCCCFSSEKEGFACNMQIHSATGHFFIHRESKELDQLLSFCLRQHEKILSGLAKKNPERYSKSHPLAQNPCKASSHKNLHCPIGAYAHAD
jgi:hypothetical protein